MESEPKKFKNNDSTDVEAHKSVSKAVLASELFKDEVQYQPERESPEPSKKSPEMFFIGHETGPLSEVSTSGEVEIAEADEVYEILKATLAKQEAKDLAEKAKTLQEIKENQEQQQQAEQKMIRSEIAAAAKKAEVACLKVKSANGSVRSRSTNRTIDYQNKSINTPVKPSTGQDGSWNVIVVPEPQTGLGGNTDQGENQSRLA